MSIRPFSVCVYCGARPGARPEYIKAAQEMGTAIASAGHRLVYGAGDIGLMGTVANAATAAGGETFGVIPNHLMEAEVGKADLTHLVVTETMHERKKVMVMNADAFVILPGGFGSMDEFFELVTWRQLGLHSKPCYILNVEGYWDHLLSLIEHQIAEGFVSADNQSYFEACADVPGVMAALTRDAGL